MIKTEEEGEEEMHILKIKTQVEVHTKELQGNK